MNYEQAESVKGLAPEVNKVLEGFGWKWQPKVGEWFMHKRKLLLLTYFRKHIIELSEIDLYGEEEPFGYPKVVKKRECTPILPWETIERILEKAGYYFEEPIKRVYGSERSKCHCVIKRKGNPKPVGCAWGDSRQEAVYRAVIELGKEIKQ